MAKGQRARTKKVSKGIHGAGGKGVKLSEVQKINLGGGLLRGLPKRWKEKTPK